MTIYHADSKGNYDVESVKRDLKNGVKRIEIDFSAYADALLEQLKGQEDYYKK